MGTLSRILIKGIDKEQCAHLIRTNYSIGRTSIFDYQFREAFFDKMNNSFIVFDAHKIGWTAIEWGFYKSVEEHDHFLMDISKNYNTTVLLGYNQTTSGDVKLLSLKNGKIQRSIYRKCGDPYKILMEYNIGEKLPYEEAFNYPDIGQEVGEDHKLLDFDEIQEMFAECGYVGAARNEFDEHYLHLEYLK